VFEDKTLKMDKRKMQENEIIRKMEEKRAKEIERGQREVFLERSSGEIIYKLKALPVYTSILRMLIISKTIKC